MAEWSAIRRLARQKHAAVRARLGLPEAAVISAGKLVAQALQAEGLSPYPLPPSDPLLSGAHAVLDRDALAIWHNGDLPQAATHFNLAHEMAHWWLHNEAAVCGAEEIAQDPLADPLPYGQEYVSGYSPAQRREVEANVFAAEFLLPATSLRSAFLHGATADELVTATGLSQAAVLAQMAEALLLPIGATEKPDDTRPAEQIQLDPSQRAAAEIEQGPTLVIAGPGTGKTRTLVSRVLVLLERGVPPEEILALTFSNKAANEMRERLEAVVPEAARRIWIGTFHAFGLELLRRFGTHLSLPPAPVLLDPLDAIALMERHLAELDLREYEYMHDPTFPMRDILSAISRAKDELKTPADYKALADAMVASAADEKAEREAARAQEIAHIYKTWQDILQREGRLDFGDLLMRAVELLEQCPDVRQQLRRQYTQVLVDEYQDINRASAVLVKLVVGEGGGLWAVGDLRQAIYRFRGASPANLTAFEQDYPTGQRLTLDVNYRSSAPLVSLFGATASAMTGEPSTWQANRTEAHAAITVAEADDETAQADGIAAEIRRFQTDGFALRDQAVLCRTNAQAVRLADALESRGLPVVYLGDLFWRSEVKDMLALLSLASEGSGQGLWRVARFPEYQTTEEQIETLLAWAKESGTRFPSALGASVRSEFERLSQHITPLAYRSDAYTFLARYLFGPSDYLRNLLRDDSMHARQKLIALHQLLLLARGHAARLGRDEERSLRSFLEHVRRLIATQEDGRARVPAGADDLDGVRLMTVHASKGLEFPVVFVPNLSKDLFPPRKPGSLTTLPPGLYDEAQGEEGEEERLLFVALSRARDHLVLSRALKVGGKSRPASPLLRLLEPLLIGGAKRAIWRSDNLAQTEVASALHASASSSVETDEEHSLGAVEQYMRCPRQYYYQRVVELPISQERSAYRRFQDCVWRVIAWLREETSSGREPDKATVDAKLEEVWAQCGPKDHPHEALLRGRAKEMLRRLLSEEASPPEPAELVADLQHGRIRLPVDAIRSEGDTVTTEHYDSGRPGKSDHTLPRHALTREALKQTHGDKQAEVTLRYLSTGEKKTVPEQPRWEPARVNRYDEALRGIRRREFPIRPSDDLCSRCPFFFICPAPDR